MERFYYGEFVSQETHKLIDRGLNFLPIFAYILVPPILDTNKFGENVALNRGMNVKTFDNIDDGLHWLKLLPSDD